MIRGQEGDRIVAPLYGDRDLPEWARAMANYWPVELCVRYYRNVASYLGEEDFHVARVMNAASSALKNVDEHSDSFIFIDSFDPHEPWYVPEPYRSLYGDYRADTTCWPPYPWTGTADRFFRDTSDADREYIKPKIPAIYSYVSAIS